MRLCARLIRSESFHGPVVVWPIDGHAFVVIQRQPAASCENTEVDNGLEFNRNSAGFKLGQHLMTKGAIQISVFCTKCLIF